MDASERIQHPSMEYYREVYKNSTLWDGQDLGGKRVVVYCEQGLGDAIQFFRYLPLLRRNVYKLYLHCPRELMRLVQFLEPSTQIDKIIDKTNPNLPKHDYHFLSMDLPFAFDFQGERSAHTKFPYIVCPEKEDLSEFEGLKIGIAWEGNPNLPTNSLRSCPLKHFFELPGHKFSLQKTIYDKSYLEGCMDKDLLWGNYNDMADTAKLINSLDLVVSIDTSVLHLAAAMDKTCFGLISTEATDGRYNDVVVSDLGEPFMSPRWYPNMKALFRGPSDTWDEMFVLLKNALDQSQQSP